MAERWGWDKDSLTEQQRMRKAPAATLTKGTPKCGGRTAHLPLCRMPACPVPGSPASREHHGRAPRTLHRTNPGRLPALPEKSGTPCRSACQRWSASWGWQGEPVIQFDPLGATAPKLKTRRGSGGELHFLSSPLPFSVFLALYPDVTQTYEDVQEFILTTWQLKAQNSKPRNTPHHHQQD